MAPTSLEALPNELLGAIASHLDPHSVLNLRFTCTRLHQTTRRQYADAWLADRVYPLTAGGLNDLSSVIFDAVEGLSVREIVFRVNGIEKVSQNSIRRLNAIFEHLCSHGRSVSIGVRRARGAGSRSKAVQQRMLSQLRLLERTAREHGVQTNGFIVDLEGTDDTQQPMASRPRPTVAESLISFLHSALNPTYRTLDFTLRFSSASNIAPSSLPRLVLNAHTALTAHGLSMQHWRLSHPWYRAIRTLHSLRLHDCGIPHHVLRGLIGANSSSLRHLELENVRLYPRRGQTRVYWFHEAAWILQRCVQLEYCRFHLLWIDRSDVECPRRFVLSGRDDVRRETFRRVARAFYGHVVDGVEVESEDEETDDEEE